LRAVQGIRPGRREALIVAVLLGMGLMLVVGLIARGSAPGPLHVDQTPVLPGEEMRLTANGFYPLEPVTVEISTRGASSPFRRLGTVSASVWGGLLDVPIAVPAGLDSGAHLLRATGQISRRRSSTTLYVRARSPWVTFGTDQAQPRGLLGLIVGGFLPGERVRILIGPPHAASTEHSGSGAPIHPIAVAVLSTDQAGNSGWEEVRLPRVAPGQYSIIAQGERSHLEGRRELTIVPYSPSITLSPWAGPPGTKLQLNARGFEPGERVAVHFGGTARLAAILRADRDGNLWGAGPVRIPFGTAAGSVSVTLVGEDSGARAVALYRVLQPRPWLELTQYWGAPGGSVQFSGGGWAGGERISIHIGSAASPPVAFGQADDYGWLHDAGPVSIPLEARYQVTFVAVGEESHAVAAATFKVVLPFNLSPGGSRLLPTPTSVNG